MGVIGKAFLAALAKATIKSCVRKSMDLGPDERSLGEKVVQKTIAKTIARRKRRK